MIALYRPKDSEAIKLSDGTFTIPGQAYADVRVRYDGEGEMFLLIPIDRLPGIIFELHDVLSRHNAKVGKEIR